MLFRADSVVENPINFELTVSEISIGILVLLRTTKYKGNPVTCY